MTEKIALMVGGLLTAFGVLGIVFGFFPSNGGDGALAIAGAVIFGSGVIAKAILEGRSQ